MMHGYDSHRLSHQRGWVYTLIHQSIKLLYKWWLGMDTSQGSQCALCSDNALDTLGHHAITCKAWR